ncbi:MAG: alpha/beta fold hydrolase [Bacteroidota bacterium]
MIKYLAAFILFLATCSAYAQKADLLQQTKTVITHLQQKQFDSMYALFNADMQRQLSVSDIEIMWESFTEKYDSLTDVHETSIRKKDSLWMSETKLDFVKKSFILQLSLSSDGVVCGIFFRNINVPYAPPAYINMLTFYELKLNIAAKGISNEGILSLPKNNVKPPLVIIVGGSGPTGMDANSGPNKPYKDLAWALASEGVATYRYNKRTFNKANINMKHAAEFGLKEEYGDDIKALVNYFSRSDKIDTKRIYILGHSEGGFMLPYFAKENANKVKGYISLAGNVSTIADMLPYQFRFLKSLNPDSTAGKIFDDYIAKAEYMQRHVKSSTVEKDSMVLGMTLYYLKDMEKHQPANLISYLNNKPFLAIQGGRDYQVPPTELDSWKTLLKDACCAEFKTFDKLNHVMMEGEGAPNPSEYSAPANIPEYVPLFISGWILNQK